MRTKTTVQAILDTRRPDKNGKFPIKIRVTENRANRIYSISDILEGYSKADFDQIKSGKPRGNLKDVAITIDNNLFKARQILESLKEFSFERFKQSWDGKGNVPKNLTLENAFEWRINKLQNEGRASSAENSRSANRSFINHFGGKRTLTSIQPKDLAAYLTAMKQRGKSVSTVGIYARDLRRLYNELIQEELIPKEYYPFGKEEFRTPRGKKSKTALKIEDIRKIVNYIPDEHTKEGFCIDLWIFSYLCSGMNLKDIANITFGDIQGNFLYFVREKTERKNRTEKVIKVPLIKEAKEIIDRRGNKVQHPKSFVFPILTPNMTAIQERKQVQNINNQINKRMKKLAIKLELSMLNVNGISARDAFATISSSQGRPLKDISESLGHSDISVTQHYLAQIQDEEKMEWQTKLI